MNFQAVSFADVQNTLRRYRIEPLCHITIESRVIRHENFCIIAWAAEEPNRLVWWEKEEPKIFYIVAKRYSNCKCTTSRRDEEGKITNLLHSMSRSLIIKVTGVTKKQLLRVLYHKKLKRTYGESVTDSLINTGMGWERWQHIEQGLRWFDSTKLWRNLFVGSLTFAATTLVIMLGRFLVWLCT